MRIIAGEFRSRKLQSPPENAETRPIPDRVKESLFNLLRGHFEDAHILDAFAGTGSIGLEALSRGAAFCTFIERDRAVAKVLEANIKALGCEDRSQIVVGDALGAASLARLHERIHVAFFDPPYAVVTNDLGWRRTRDQFSRVLAQLDEGGFLVHRTPWPFVQTPDPAHAPEPESPEPTRRGRARDFDHDSDQSDHGDLDQRVRRHKRSRKAEAPPEMPPIELSLDLSDPEADAALDAFEASLADITQPEPSPEIDLALPGAIGPESHPYGTTCIHLYQAAPR